MFIAYAHEDRNFCRFCLLPPTVVPGEGTQILSVNKGMSCLFPTDKALTPRATGLFPPGFELTKVCTASRSILSPPALLEPLLPFPSSRLPNFRQTLSTFALNCSSPDPSVHCRLPSAAPLLQLGSWRCIHFGAKPVLIQPDLSTSKEEPPNPDLGLGEAPDALPFLSFPTFPCFFDGSLSVPVPGSFPRPFPYMR